MVGEVVDDIIFESGEGMFRKRVLFSKVLGEEGYGSFELREEKVFIKGWCFNEVGAFVH